MYHGGNMNKNLKSKIIEKYGFQADFAQKAGFHESLVSRVLRGRRLLTKEESEKWKKILQCDSQILVPVTKSE